MDFWFVNLCLVVNQVIFEVRSYSIFKALVLTGVLLVAMVVLIEPTRVIEPTRAIASTLIAKAMEEVETQVAKRRSVEDVVTTYGDDARSRLKPNFKKAKTAYPPEKVTLIGLKEEKLLIVFANTKDGGMTEVLRYPILAASGVAGPKLKQGDCQVPEGFYKIEALQPNSKYHLALRVSYPNDEDRKHGKKDKRTNLGGDIMIHGNECSIGCLAMGDTAIEELFVLASDCGRENIDVILAPCNLIEKDLIIADDQPTWVKPLYERLKAALSDYL